MMTQEAGEVFALNVLGWLVGQEDLLPVFLGATGASEADLKARAGDPEFLLSVLDFVMMDDAWIMSCSDALRVPYDRVASAKAALPGGMEVSWT